MAEISPAPSPDAEPAIPEWVPIVHHIVGGYGALCAGLLIAGFHEEIHSYLKKKTIPGVLAQADKNYDESLARTYRDKSLDWLRQTIMFLMRSSVLTLLFYKFVVSDYDSRLNDIALAIGILYTGVFEYRLKKAFDPYETNFGVMGRNFYKFYPLLDEHDCLIRSVKLDESHSLKQKWNLMVSARLSEFLFSTLYHVAILTPWIAYSYKNVSMIVSKKVNGIFIDENVLQPVPLLLSALYLTVATTCEVVPGVWTLIHSIFGDNEKNEKAKAIAEAVVVKLNISPINWIDTLQRYLAVWYLKRPIISIATPSYLASRTKWEGQTSIPVAHFNHLLLHNKPWSQFLISEVYNPARKAGDSKGYAMAKFILARAIAFMGILAIFHNSNNKTLVFKVFVCLWINYAGHALFRYIEQDGKVEWAKNRDYRRNDDVRDIAFGAYKLIALIFDYFFFTMPMIALMFSKNLDLTANSGNQAAAPSN